MMGRTSKNGRVHVSVLLSGAVVIILMVSGGIQTIISDSSVAGIVGLVLMDVTALQIARKQWPTPGLTRSFGIAIPALGAVVALAQFPSLGWVNVGVGLALVAAGLIFYSMRSRSQSHDKEAHDELVRRMEAPLMRAPPTCPVVERRAMVWDRTNYPFRC